MSTTKRIEKKNVKRMIKEVNKDSRTLPAQLLTLWHNHAMQLVSIKSDGSTVAYGVTKEEAIGYIGMKPHFIGKGEKKKCVGYTPATFNAAVAEELLVRNDQGKVMQTYVYRDRTVMVESYEESNDEGHRSYSLYTLEEATKKAKGESGAKAIKVYRKCMIDTYGWGPELIDDVLFQSTYIADETKRAEKSRESWDAIEHVYIVKTIDGVNKVIEIDKPALEF
jgi:hypothetical protein